MNNVSLFGAWRIYRTSVVPTDADAVQINETQRAFYAGAIFLIEVMKRIGEDDVSEATGVETIAALDREAARFLATLGAD